MPTSPAITPPSTAVPVSTLVDEFLAEQSRMTAVDRFTDAHARDAAPRGATRWRDLLPIAPPGPGQQYAFEVDLDACSGCKACVVACHALNGLDEGEAWRDVGLLVGTGTDGLVQPVTTGCHHCADPGCLSGCPVDAYVKDDDGIVRHLDDQCIGCSYCTLTCPYEVPQYNRSRGIVRKCDLCRGRLQDGEAPACVQACPTRAIQVTVVDVDRAGRDGWGFVAPDPAATRPTTIYRSRRDLATQVAPADLHAVQPRHAHPPLAVMLVLTQLAVGAVTILEGVRGLGLLPSHSAVTGAVVALVLTAIALVASLAHLGRPLYAWRAVIGLRHSWLSREIVAFGAFAAIGTVHALTLGGWAPNRAGVLPVAVTGTAVVASGLVAVATSVMVYVATGRAGWRPAVVGARFGATTLGLGLLAAALVVAATTTHGPAPMLAAVACMVLVGTLIGDLLPLRHTAGDPAAASTRTARILRGPLAAQVQLRVGAGVVAAMLAAAGALALTAEATHPGVVLLLGGLVVATAGELVARSWFFTAEGSLRMPGAPA